MAAVMFHPVQTTRLLACDECGCAVPADDRERQAHQEWHDERSAIVVDLRSVRERLTA